MNFIQSLIYFQSYSLIKFQMKNEVSDTAKQIAPKVSSRGQEAKWVSGMASVQGWNSALPTI